MKKIHPVPACLRCLRAEYANAPLNTLSAYLNRIGIAQAEQRAQAVAAIRTKAEAQQRQSQVRQKILDSSGDCQGQRVVPVKTYGSVPGEGFRVEKIAYESLPGYHVTANVFVPEGAGRSRRW